MDSGVLIESSYRRITPDDLPWMMSLAYERYGPYDPGGTLLFLLESLRSPRALMIRSEDAFLIAATVAPPWYPDRTECHVAFLCAAQGAHWQAIRLLRESVAWARLRKCVRWRFHSETGSRVDALCRRIGAVADTPRYKIDL